MIKAVSRIDLNLKRNAMILLQKLVKNIFN